MTNCNQIAAVTILSLSMTGCGWVDSAGDGGQAARETTVITASGNVLVADGAVPLTENAATRFLLVNAPEVSGPWTWRANASTDAINLCRQEPDFDSDVAVDTLNQACSSDSNCEFVIEESNDNSSTSFDLTLPTLRAPVALGFTIEATLASGEQYSQAQTVCGIAINEAPETQDDHYLALTSTTRVVSAEDAWAVFSNDSDDDHVRNVPLFIQQVTQPPVFAENVELLSDGSFEYTPRLDLNLEADESLEDSMEVLISDGTHEVTSLITIRIVTTNSSPSTSGGIPDIVAPVDDNSVNTFSIDFNDLINNADNDPLRFQLIGNELTESGVLSFDESGVLSGTLTLDNVGTEQFTLLFTDGLFELSETFSLIIRDDRTDNNSSDNTNNNDPEVSDIPNTRVSGSFSYDVAEFFVDPDGDPLTFSSDNLPPGITMSRAGLISGTATSDNDGRWLIRITASDNRGGTVDDQFRMTIDFN